MCIHLRRPRTHLVARTAKHTGDRRRLAGQGHRQRLCGGAPMTPIDVITGELRKCTDCGLCLAACPTFTTSRTEGDSPRGRIHLIASLLASGTASPVAVAHLSNCIECSACH